MPELIISSPPFPNRDPYPFAATTRYRKMVIDIENLDGSIREGVSPSGEKWKTKFEGAHYGEIRGSKGTDGDPLDVYIKNPPDEGANIAYIVHQNHPRTHPDKPGEYDEDKVVLGVSSLDEAKELYLKHYNRKDFLRSVTAMPIESFKRYIFGENKADKVARFIPDSTAFIRMKMRGDYEMPTECKTPGEKLRSKGKGRGLARGKGKGPIGIPYKYKKKASLDEMFKLGFELALREKFAQGPNLTASMMGAMPQPTTPPATQHIPGVTAPNWPTQMPQHGGPVGTMQDALAAGRPPALNLKPRLTANLD